MNISAIFKAVAGKLGKYSPEIMVGLGIGTMIFGAVVAVNASRKADVKMEELEERCEKEFNDGQREDNTPTIKEKAKYVWTSYIFAGVTISAGAALIIAAMIVKNKRFKALAAMYTLSVEALKAHREKLEELAGSKEKMEEISNEINEKIETRIHDTAKGKRKLPSGVHRYSINEVYDCIPGNGFDLIYDEYGGRYFWSSVDDVEKAFAITTAEAARDPYGDWCVNDMYDELNLDHTEAGSRGYSEVSPRMAGLAWDTYSPNGKISIWKFNFQKEFDY